MDSKKATENTSYADLGSSHHHQEVGPTNIRGQDRSHGAVIEDEEALVPRSRTPSSSLAVAAAPTAAPTAVLPAVDSGNNYILSNTNDDDRRYSVQDEDRTRSYDGGGDSRSRSSSVSANASSSTGGTPTGTTTTTRRSSRSSSSSPMDHHDGDDGQTLSPIALHILTAESTTMIEGHYHRLFGPVIMEFPYRSVSGELGMWRPRSFSHLLEYLWEYHYGEAYINGGGGGGGAIYNINAPFPPPPTGSQVLDWWAIKEDEASEIRSMMGLWTDWDSNP